MELELEFSPKKILVLKFSTLFILQMNTLQPYIIITIYLYIYIYIYTHTHTQHPFATSPRSQLLANISNGVSWKSQRSTKCKGSNHNIGNCHSEFR